MGASSTENRGSLGSSCKASESGDEQDESLHWLSTYRKSASHLPYLTAERMHSRTSTLTLVCTCEVAGIHPIRKNYRIMDGHTSQVGGHTGEQQEGFLEVDQ